MMFIAAITEVESFLLSARRSYHSSFSAQEPIRMRKFFQMDRTSAWRTDNFIEKLLNHASTINEAIPS